MSKGRVCPIVAVLVDILLSSLGFQTERNGLLLGFET